MKNFKILFAVIFLIAVSSCKKDRHFIKNDNVSPNDFLSSSKYDKLVVEVQYMAGYQPSSAALNRLTTLLQERLNKPDGIMISQKSISAQGKAVYSSADVEAIEKAERTQNTKGNTLTAYILFLDGDYSDNSGSSKVLGLTYANSSMVIFEKAVKDFSGGLSQPSTDVLESTVVNHEFGHVLGLVNNGTTMQSSHQSNGAHCNNKNCLMYYQAETSDIIGNLIGNNVPSFDSNCLNDLKGNGGK
jgi:predicted Zn-dependent protease